MVVLTPHWHSEGEPGKHTWSGRSSPPPSLAWTCPVPRGVSGCWGFRGGAGGLYLRSHRPPATLLAQPPASWGQRGRDPPHPLVERIALIWGLPPPSRPCRVGGALWEMVGGFGWRERRQTAPAVKGRRPALRRGAGRRPRTRRPKAAGSRPGTAGFLHLFDLVYGPVAAAHTLSAARPASTARVGAELTKAWLGPRALLRVAGPRAGSLRLPVSPPPVGAAPLPAPHRSAFIILGGLPKEWPGVMASALSP